jgi:hypothetical protein
MNFSLFCETMSQNHKPLMIKKNFKNLERLQRESTNCIFNAKITLILSTCFFKTLWFRTERKTINQFVCFFQEFCSP